MDFARQAMKDRAKRMNGLPEDKHNDATEGDDVIYLMQVVVRQQHSYVKTPKD
jgi:hypothetical protein